MTRSLSLRLLSGEEQGRTVEIPRAGLLIGRREGNDLVLEDASVSGRHALVRPEGERAWVEDLGSTNGTQVDGKRVDRAELEPGCRISFGKIEVLVVAGGEAGARAPAAGSDAPAQRAQSAPAAVPAEPAGLDVDELSLEDVDELSLEDVDELSLEDVDTLLDVPVQAPAAMPGAPVDLPARSLAEEFEEPALNQVEALRPRKSASSAKRTPAPAALSDTELGDGMSEVDAAILDRARKKSRGPFLGLIGLVVIAAGAGGYFLTGAGEDGEGARESARDAAPLQRPGNRLAASAASFESSEAPGWSTPELSPVRFATARVHASSGKLGIGLEPAAGQWGELCSEPVAVAPGAELGASAQVSSTGPSALRLGLRLESSADESLAMTFWSERLAGDVDELELTAGARVPSGFDRASVVLLGGDAAGRTTGGGGAELRESLGRVSFDDVGLALDAGEPLASARVGDFELVSMPGAAGQALLVRGERPLMSLRSGEDFALGPAGRLTVERAAPADVLDTGGRLELTVQGRAMQLELYDLLLGPQARIAAIAGGEHRELPARFRLEDVEELILGGGLDLIALRFDPPVALTAEPDGGLVRVSVQGVVRAQARLAFDEARQQATILSAAAERAEQEERLGDVIAVWSQLLDTVPYEPALVARANAAIGNLRNLAETDLRATREALERASFFKLPSMYAEVIEQAHAIETRFMASEPGTEDGPVAAEVRALIAEAQARIEGLGGRDAAVREARLEAVYGLLRESGAGGIVQEAGARGGQR